MYVCINLPLSGGGIRGLFSVQMMIELSKYLHDEFRNYFDWICGTSTGALIASLLAKGNNLHTIRKLYFQFKDQIMIGKRPYNENKLELLFKNEFDDNVRMCDLLNRYGKHVLFYGTLVTHRPPTLRIFRSYSYPCVKENSKSIIYFKVWKALRASTAAPLYFKSYKPYIDGGLLANNPTLDSLVEFFRYQSSIRKCNIQRTEDKLVESKLKVVLSFGNGHEEAQLKDLSDIYNRLNSVFDVSSMFHFRELIHIHKLWPLGDQIKFRMTNCNEHIVARSENWCSACNILFFRINPLLSKKVFLDETNILKLINGLWDVKVYAFQKAMELKQLAQVIDRLMDASSFSSSSK